MLKDIVLILVGAFIGLASTLFLEYKRRIRDKYDRREHGKKILASIIDEVKMGVKRCEGLANMLDRTPPNMSFSRIYTDLWDSSIVELTRCIEDPEIFKLLDSIYYCFDLVNFNMNRSEFGVGAAFAKNKLQSIKEDLERLESRFSKIPDAPLLNTPTLDHIFERLRTFSKRF